MFRFTRGEVTTVSGEIPMRRLGSTGEMVSCIGVGGFHLSVPPPEEATRLVREALDRGINFFDNCWDYAEGESERRLGNALLNGYRERAFVMTKVDGRTKQAARRQLEESLRRLKTDHIDLLQLHEVIRWNDPEEFFAPGGGIEAFLEARDAGKVRYIGFTGHKRPDIHLKMLEQDFPWDAVQMPLNVLDAHYESFTRKVLPVLVDRDIGVLGMKPFAAGQLFDAHAVSAAEALRYALNLPASVIITGMQSHRDLEQAIRIARTFRTLKRAEVAAILAKTAPVSREGKFEGYKTTNVFDSTDWNPEWLVV